MGSPEVQRYEDLCAYNGCSVDQFVKKCINTAVYSGVLNLAGHSVSVETGKIIAEILQESKAIIKINATDCLIPPEALEAIISIVECSNVVVGLNLHGNNISGDMSALLGKMLVSNSTLKSLELKWNNMGTTADTFGIFCNGLAENTGLESLDLRCNVLCQHCAHLLAQALRSNKTLRTLDLRWNKIESEGAEALLNALEVNKSITAIHTEGNFIRRDLILSLEQAARNNVNMARMQADMENKSKKLTEHIKHLEEQSSTELDNLRKFSITQTMEADSHITQLTKSVTEKESLIQSLENQLLTLQSSLSREQQRADALQRLIEDKEKLHLDLIASHQATVDVLKKELDERDRDIVAIKTSVDKRCDSEKETIEKLKIELALQQHEADNYKAEYIKLKTKLEVLIKQHSNEMENQKLEFLNHISQMERSNDAALQKTISAALEKQQHLENSIIALTEKQSGNLLLVTERMEKLKEEKSALESELDDAKRTIGKLARENAHLLEQLQEPAKKITSLMKEISDERFLNDKLKQERLEECRITESLRNDIRKLQDELRDSERKNQLLVDQHSEDIIQYKNKIRQLTIKIEDKDRKIEFIRNEEKDKAKVLFSAFKTYLKEKPDAPSFDWSNGSDQ